MNFYFERLTARIFQDPWSFVSPNSSWRAKVKIFWVFMCSTSAVSHDDKRMDGVKCPICPQPRLSNQLTYQTWRWQQNFLRNVAPPPALKLYLGRYLLMFLMSSSHNKYWEGATRPSSTFSQCYQVSSQVNHVLEINMLHSYSYFHGSLVRWTLNIADLQVFLFIRKLQI